VADRPIAGARRADRTPAVLSAVVLGLVVALLGGLLAIVFLARPTDRAGAGAQADTSPSPSSYLLAGARPAPALELIDPQGRPVSLASLRGEQVLVFFGYTHCPDVCPVTIGNVSEALGKIGPGTRALFVTVDPERDTTTWLQEYAKFMPAGFTPLTGTAAQIRRTADAWGVRYARVETDDPSAYSMSHTADVFLVDADGVLRAKFPFGTPPEAMEAVVGEVAATTPPVAAAAASASPVASAAGPPSVTPVPTASAPPTTASSGGAAASLRPEVVSTSVWAGGSSPVIIALNDDAGRLDDQSIAATVQLLNAGGTAAGPVLPATAVRPPGVDRVSYVATLDIPSPGQWRLAVNAFPDGRQLSGSVDVTALDPGSTPALGGPAPTVHTPTLADVGGVARAVTTDPMPDLRLSRTSTTDALAAHEPFVLVVDSTRFRVTPVCGKAVVMARYLQDRWPDVPFIHLEPYPYHVEADTAVLDGDISNPPVNEVATAWGTAGAPWGAKSMPWVFVVDGNGIVRAKYQGLMGSDDVDVMLSLITGQTKG
jgi:protein SCO1/2